MPRATFMIFSLKLENINFVTLLYFYSKKLQTARTNTNHEQMAVDFPIEIRNELNN